MRNDNCRCKGLFLPGACHHAPQGHDGDNEYTVLVDNTASRENVTRYAEHQGYTVSVSETDGVYTLICRK